jgi:SAM-dependent methyltransferase
MLPNKINAIFSNYGVRLWKKILQKIYHFDKWHVVSLRQRKYARDIIVWCNNRETRTSFLEIGCGLGDVVRNVKYRERYGFDSDPKVLKAAAFLARSTPGRKITFSFCEFPVTPIQGNYDILIMVNWVHHIEPSVLHAKLKEYFATLINEGGAIIIDTVHHPEYKFNHVIGHLAEGLNASIEKLGSYERGREVWALKKAFSH